MGFSFTTYCFALFLNACFIYLTYTKSYRNEKHSSGIKHAKQSENTNNKNNNNNNDINEDAAFEQALTDNCDEHTAYSDSSDENASQSSQNELVSQTGKIVKRKRRTTMKQQHEKIIHNQM